MHAPHWLLHFPTLDVDLLARVQDILRKGERVKNQAQTRKGGAKQKGTVWASKFRHEI